MFCWASAQTRPKTVEFCLSCSHFYVCKDDRIFRKSQPALTDGLNSNTKCIVIVLIQHSNIVALNGYYYLLLAQASRASKFDRSLTLYFYNSKPCHWSIWCLKITVIQYEYFVFCIFINCEFSHSIEILKRAHGKTVPKTKLPTQA